MPPIPNSVCFGHFLREIINVAAFAAYLAIVLVTLARQHRSLFRRNTPRDRALVPSTVVLTVEE